MMNSLRKYLPGKMGQIKPVVPVVRLQGAIGAPSTFRKGLNIASVAPLLDQAFKLKDTPAVAIVINSPGGAPAQSHLIYKRIRQLAEEHNKDVLVFVEDVAASGGYMIALAGDEIYVDPTSIVGSIGVVMAGFGFTDLIDKIGVERRVYTAGEKKVTLDPFAPAKEDDIEYIKSLQGEIHEVFIDMVKSRRGDVLSDDKDIFSGLFWTGHRAHELGLVDGVNDLYSVLQERYGKDVKPKYLSAKRGFFGKVMTKSNLGSQIHEVCETLPASALSVVEERSLWARFGL
ncbi:S49 family peptidase [Rhodobacteraceae bacterium RKSG542]|uniref:S49 family peptidase n=1 Tax=Pseudovibrio flavus TaxID=2529854 RepID=UPI0012BD823D|nr:S49 family peptidase [Pseudovibrio flavus]MTI18699.1 S49 family peptidase [Pseudovibrio flavus]